MISRFCDECQHSEFFTFPLHVFKGSDGRANVVKTLSSVDIFPQWTYYNKHVFFWPYLNSYVSFGGRVVADSKCVEGSQGTGGPTSKYYCPQTLMTFPEMANPHRRLFNSDNKILLDENPNRNFIIQEEDGSKYEVVNDAFELLVDARKGESMSRPAYINQAMTTMLKEILSLNLTGKTNHETEIMICQGLAQVRQEAYDCILPKQFKDIGIFNTKIRDQVTTTKPKPKTKSKAKPITSSERGINNTPYKGVFVKQLRLLLANRNIKFNSKMKRATLVALAVASDSIDYNMHDEIDNNPGTKDDSTDYTGAGNENDNVENTQRASSATPDDVEYIKTIMVLLFLIF